MSNALSTTVGLRPTTGSIFMISGVDRAAGFGGAVLVAWVVSLSPGSRAAETPRETSFTLEQLMQSLSQVKSAKATFVERKHLRVLTAPLESSGTLAYTAPGYLERHTLAPKPESVVLDKDTLTLEDKARNRRRTVRLQDYPALWVLIEGLRSTLAGDLQNLNRLYRVALEGGESNWRLTLEPREPDLQSIVSRIRVTGNRASVRSI